ncbi:MAG: hypothetical protein HY303_09175 [Candidatus Wallbacteria bacterium]|nr:hypothetical protein [Candidatus Wallbacteria bacterium]
MTSPQSTAAGFLGAGRMLTLTLLCFALSAGQASGHAANAGPDLVGCKSLSLQIFGSETLDSGFSNQSVAWTIDNQPAGGDGNLTQADKFSPFFNATVAGAYAIRITVVEFFDTDPALKDTKTDTMTVTIGNPPTVAAGGNVNTQPNVLIKLGGSGADPQGGPVTFRWTLDATPDVPAAPCFLGTDNADAEIQSTTIAQPAFVARKAGVYRVRLTVADSGGCSSSSIADITVDSAPLVNAGPDKQTATNVAVQLEGSGQDQDANDCLTFAWSVAVPAGGDSGDALIDNRAIAQPNFTATKPGLYTLTLAITDRFGKIVTDTMTVLVDRSPTTNAGPNRRILPNTPTVLIGTATDPDGPTDALTYAWTIPTNPGGAGSFTGANTLTATFTATHSGNYTIQLQATDSHTGTGASTALITVDTTPTANAGVDVLVRTHTSITVVGSGTDPDGDALTYSLGIGQPTGGDGILSSATVPGPSFSATKPGTYVLTLTVNDGLGGTASDSANVTCNDPPVVNAGSNRSLLLPVPGPLTVNLTGSATDADGDGIVSYLWTRASGSGPPVTLQNASSASTSFVVTSVGTYTFTLAVTDAIGGTGGVGTANVTITVFQGTAPLADAGANQTIILQEGIPLSVQLSGRATDPQGLTIPTYSWTRAGGTGPAVTLTNPSGPSPTFVATVAGTYTFGMTATNSNGNVSTNAALTTVTLVLNKRPVATVPADFQVILLEGVSQTVTLTGTASDPDDDAIVSYSWTRTGGTGPPVTLTGASQPSASFTATATGTQIFELKVTDARGGVSNPAVVTGLRSDRELPLESRRRRRTAGDALQPQHGRAQLHGKLAGDLHLLAGRDRRSRRCFHQQRDGEDSRLRGGSAGCRRGARPHRHDPTGRVR